MTDYTPGCEESTSELNLSIQKTRDASPSDFVPNFSHKFSYETERRDQIDSSHFCSEISLGAASRNRSFQLDKKPPRPHQSITEIIEQATESINAKYRPRPLSMSLGNNPRKSGSQTPSRLYNTSAVHSPMTVKSTKHVKVPRSRDGSPIVKSSTRLEVERRIMNRSVELKSVIGQVNMENLSKSRTAGKSVLGATNQRKEIERQLQSLENRLNRLKLEDTIIQKKVETAAEKAEKALTNKMRHKEDLAAKEMRNKKRDESIQRRKVEINQEREETKTKASTAVLEMLKGRFNHAEKMRRLAEQSKAREEERRRREDEKKRMVKEGIKTWINSTKKIKTHNENLTKRNSSINYNEKARIERERTQDLLARCQQMEAMEQELLQKLGQTRNLHTAKLNELRSIQSANVSFVN